MNILKAFGLHKVDLIKVTLVLITVILLVGAAVTINNTNQAKNRQQAQRAQAVTNHTQTLNEIQQAVEELKTNNAADHAQTVKYINCVLVGITETPSQAQALMVYQTCLAASGAE